jgi:cyclase
MKIKTFSCTILLLYLFSVTRAFAQDLGAQFKKVKEGIYVYAAVLNEANSTIILTDDGVVLIDTGQSPKDSHVVMAAVKKLTSQPVRYIIHTEPHPDHAMGDFVFSPPALVIGHAGSADSMKASESFGPARIEKQMSASPEMREAFKGFRLITPHIEYRDKLSLNVGARVRTLLFEERSQRSGHGDLAAQGTRAVYSGFRWSETLRQSSTVCQHSGHAERDQNDESPQS